MDDKTRQAKLMVVLHNFFAKALHTIVQARTAAAHGKTNRWFNLDLAADETLRAELRHWRTDALPPLVIETYLDMRHTSARDTVVLDHAGTAHVVPSGKHEVVVERWLVELDRSSASQDQDELPRIYKHAIVLLRVLYGAARLLPAYRLRQHVARQAGHVLAVRCRLVDARKPISSKGRVGLLRPIVPGLTGLHMAQRLFAPVETSVGALRVLVAYRKQYRFGVQDAEARLLAQFRTHTTDSVLEPGASQESPRSPRTSMRRESRDSNIQREFVHEGSNTGAKPESSIQRASDTTGEHMRDTGSDPDMSDPKYAERYLDERTLRDSTREGRRDSDAPIKDDLHTLPRNDWDHAASPERRPRPSIQPFKVGSISTSPPMAHTPTSLTGSSMERRISITSNRLGLLALLAALLRNARGSTSSSTPATIAIAGSTFPRLVLLLHGSHMPDDDVPRFLSSFGLRHSRRFSNSRAPDLGTSVDLSASVPFSGLYADDDISLFVRMIDGKLDLRLSSSHADRTDLDALSRFQLLKSQHQQLGDSVSASLVLPGSKPSSRRPSHSVYLPPLLPVYDHIPSISSKLHDSDVSGSPRSLLNKSSYSGSSVSYLKGTKPASPLTATTMAHATHVPSEVSGLATSPSVYLHAKQPIQYEDVFDDDDDHYYPKTHASFDNDDLLFEMTDTK